MAMAMAMANLALVAARDPGSTRLIYAVVVALLVLGAGFAVLAWWLIRTTRPDPELLAPLEAIRSRRWDRLDPAGRRRLLDELRPVGAEPEDPAPSTPVVDDEFADVPSERDVRELGAESDTIAPSVAGEVGLRPPKFDDDLWREVDEQLGLDDPASR